MMKYTTIDINKIDQALFWAKKITDLNGCWIWTGRIDDSGYGRYGKKYLAHRISYLLTHPTENIDELVIRHNCNNRKCINPAHLLSGTIKDNIHDSIRAGTHINPTNRYIRAKQLYTPTSPFEQWIRHCWAVLCPPIAHQRDAQH